MDSSTPPPAHMDFSHHHLLLCKEICCLFLFGTTFCRFISELHGFCGAETETSSDRSDAIRILSAPLPPCLLQHRRSGPFNRPSDARTKSGDGEEKAMRANCGHTPAHNQRPSRFGYGRCLKTFKNLKHWVCLNRRTAATMVSTTTTRIAILGNRKDLSDGECEMKRGDGAALAIVEVHHSLVTVSPSLKACLNKKIPSRCPPCKRALWGGTSWGGISSGRLPIAGHIHPASEEDIWQSRYMTTV